MTTLNDAIVELYFDGVSIPDPERRELAARLRRVLAKAPSQQGELARLRAACAALRARAERAEGERDSLYIALERYYGCGSAGRDAETERVLVAYARALRAPGGEDL